MPGEGITPIYVVRHPAFEADPVEDQLRPWIKDLRRRQYIEWLPFWPEGAVALQRRGRPAAARRLPGQIAERLQRAAIRDASPHTVPLPSIHFVGRRDEMHALLTRAAPEPHRRDHGGARHPRHRQEHAGVCLRLGLRLPLSRRPVPDRRGSELGDLAAGVIGLAEPKGVPLTDDERQSPEVALAKVKAAFEAGPPALLVIDNVDDPALLSVQSRERALPKGDHIHVLVTTRISPEDLPRIRCLPLDALQTEDAMALLQSFRPIADSPQDDEWKAALEIVGRLGGHALAVEVVAVYLRENPGRDLSRVRRRCWSVTESRWWTTRPAPTPAAGLPGMPRPASRGCSSRRWRRCQPPSCGPWNTPRTCRRTVCRSRGSATC